MPKPRGGQRQQYNSSGSGSSGSRFQALNDYQNGGILLRNTNFFRFLVSLIFH